MLALKEYAEPRTRRSRTPATKTKTRPTDVLVAYSAVDTLDHGEPRDIETDLETIETAKALAENLRWAGYHAATYEVRSLADIDFLGKEFELDNLLVFNLCEHLNGRSQDDVKITTRMDKLGLQYTAFLKFNGASTNYDGAGRNASDNNTLYLLLWFSY